MKRPLSSILRDVVTVKDNRVFMPIQRGDNVRLFRESLYRAARRLGYLWSFVCDDGGVWVIKV